MLVTVNGAPLAVSSSAPDVTAMASNSVPDLGDALMPIVAMIQDLAFPVGLGMAIWGLIEFIMDNPGGKQKVKRAFIGYIGIFVLPMIFMAIRNGFAHHGAVQMP